VRTLLRVSTKEQDEDMQRKDCADRIKTMSGSGWVFDKEYVEPGLSAYKTPVAERVVLQEVLRAAAAREFEVLLVFLSDRICRNDEYESVIMSLSKTVEIWALDRGDITVRTYTDELITKIDGWQNKGESLKISLRTRAKQKQMNDEGVYTGGGVPYGYKLVLSGRYAVRDKDKRKELYDKVIDEDERVVVELIYKLVLDKGWGGSRIAQYLNSKTEYKNRDGKGWSEAVINFMLRNPHYKGYPTYGKHKQNESNKKKRVRQDEADWNLSANQVTKWVIIPEDVWERVHRIRTGRRPHDSSDYDLRVPTKGKLYFVGFIRCKDCGHTLVTAHQHRKHTRKDGSVYEKTFYKYQCSGKKKGLPCDGQRIYAREKIEEPVLEHVSAFLSRIKAHDFSDELEQQKQDKAKKLNKDATKLRKKLVQLEEEILEFEEEILLARKGKSEFTPERLASIINRKEAEKKAAEEEIRSIEDAASTERIEAKDISDLRKALPKWEVLFDEADTEKKKMMLSTIISHVIVSKEEIQVNIKLHIQQFLNITNGDGGDGLGVYFPLSRERA